MNAPAKNGQLLAGSAARAKTRFADVSHEEALARARQLIPFIRAQADLTEKTTHMPDPVLEALHQSGLFRFQQPKLWGGMELDFPAFMQLPEILARGCASTGWTFANLSSHHRQLAQWPMQAQEDVWGPDPDALIASGIAYIQGEGRLVDGGLLLCGQWGFSSGVDVSGWNMLACVVKEDGKPVDWCMCLVPRADYQIIDDWQTLGMRGTGSRSVKCKDLFVPAHRVLSQQINQPGHEFPGLAVHTNPMYRVPTSALGGNGIGASLLGNARAVLDETIESVKARSTSYSAAKMRDLPTVQLRVGMAGAKIDGAYAWMHADCVEAANIVKGGGRLDIATKLRFRRNSAMMVKMATGAIDSLHEMAGANGIYDKYPIQRMFRDAHAAAGHIVFSLDAQLLPWGLAALGGEFNSPTM